MIVRQRYAFKDATTEIQTAYDGYKYACLRRQVLDDVVFFWGPRMLRAVRRNKKLVSNRWSFNAGADEQYAQLLSAALGSNFEVHVIGGVTSKRYIEVRW